MLSNFWNGHWKNETYFFYKNDLLWSEYYRLLPMMQGWKKPWVFSKNSDPAGFFKKPRVLLGFFKKTQGFLGFFGFFKDLIENNGCTTSGYNVKVISNIYITKMWI